MVADRHRRIDEVAEEFAALLRGGQKPDLEDYVRQHSECGPELRDVLSGVILMEELKPRRDDLPLKDRSIALPERIGDFKVVREIARGGMGIVYEAEQQALGRRVAIKLLPNQLTDSDKLKARFRREAQAAARLHHTNIVPVFGVGESDGQCFYIMQLIHGKSLDKVIRAGGTAGKSPKTIARIGVQVAEALEYAHSQGVVHRDIKPSNLLIDDRGTVWVTDFGVAKRLDDTDLTRTGDLLGTMRYMPPERFDGQSDAVGDVYSLGVTLYELLTGQGAFPETTPQRLIQLISQTGLAPLNQRSRDIPADLQTIIMKAVSREPEGRYQSAAALGDDLRRFVEDRPIKARRIGPFAQLRRWAKRNPAMAGLGALAFGLMIAITLVSNLLAIKSQSARKASEDAKVNLQAALEGEQRQREQSERTAALALNALNRTFHWFAPTRLVAAPAGAPDGIELPPQPASLPPDAVPLLEELLATYDRIAKAGEGFAALRPQVAEANHRRGDLDQRLGRYDDAIHAYRTAVGLYEQLRQEHGDGEWLVKLARAHNEIGRVQRLMQKYDESDQSHRKVETLLGEAAAEEMAKPECQFELALAHYSVSQRDMFRMKGPPRGERGPPSMGERGPRPDSRIQAAIDILTPLVRDHGDVAEYRHLLALCCRETPDQHQEGQRLFRELINEYPNVPDYRFGLCESLGRLAGPGPNRGEGEEGLNEAIAVSDELAEQYPMVPEYAAANARYHDFASIRASKRKDYAEAVKESRLAVERQEQLVKLMPKVTLYRLWLGFMERTLGDALAGQGKHEEARTQIAKGVCRVESLDPAIVKLEGVRRFLGMAYSQLARECAALNLTKEAAAAMEKSQSYGGFHGPR